MWSRAASYLEVMAGRGSPHGGVWIDATHLGEKFLLENFPGMVERCEDNGFDLLHTRVEVSPSAHYQMGGVYIDTECRTNIEGLFAAGEDASGVHGANRLGGNGVADSIVFGALAGDVMSQSLSASDPGPPSADYVREVCFKWSAPLERQNGERPNVLRREIETLMWEKVGLVRNGKDLESALDGIGRTSRACGPAKRQPWTFVQSGVERVPGCHEYLCERGAGCPRRADSAGKPWFTLSRGLSQERSKLAEEDSPSEARRQCRCELHSAQLPSAVSARTGETGFVRSLTMSDETQSLSNRRTGCLRPLHPGSAGHPR